MVQHSPKQASVPGDPSSSLGSVPKHPAGTKRRKQAVGFLVVLGAVAVLLSSCSLLAYSQHAQMGGAGCSSTWRLQNSPRGRPRTLSDVSAGVDLSVLNATKEAELQQQQQALQEQAEELQLMRAKLDNLTEAFHLRGEEQRETDSRVKGGVLGEEDKARQLDPEDAARMGQLAQVLEALQSENRRLEEQKAGEQEGAAGDQVHDSWTARLTRGRFNASTPRPINAGDPKEWKQRSFTPHGFYGFIQYSAYRIGPHTFGVAGMAEIDMMMRQQRGDCRWHAANGSAIPGILHHYYEQHAEGRRYTAQVLRCTLSADSGDGGGFLIGQLNQEEMVLYREDPGQPQGESDGFKYTLAHCSAPIYGPQETAYLRQWFDFHRVHAEVDHFTLYNVDAVDTALSRALKPYVAAGMLEIVDVEQMLAFDFYLYGQMVMIYDCMYSMALRSRWVLFLDFDEYLEAIPPNTVQSLLAAHVDNAWLSHGALLWDVTKCLELDNGTRGNGTEVFGVERMVFRRPEIYCFEEPKPPETRETCTRWRGHRKLIVNPRKVTMVQVHVGVLWHGNFTDLNAGSQLRHNHFRSINAKGAGKCTRLFSRQEVPEGAQVGGVHIRDGRVARLMATIRSKPFPRKRRKTHVLSAN